MRHPKADRCPSCGATLIVPDIIDPSGRVSCEYCGARVKIEPTIGRRYLSPGSNADKTKKSIALMVVSSILLMIGGVVSYIYTLKDVTVPIEKTQPAQNSAQVTKNKLAVSRIESFPAICKSGEIALVENKTLTLSETMVVLEQGCTLKIKNSKIVAPWIAKEARKAKIIIENSAIKATEALLDPIDGAAYIHDLTINGSVLDINGKT